MERETIVAVQKNRDGDLTAFKTSTGRVLDYSQALAEVQNGNIAGVNAFKGRDGELIFVVMLMETRRTIWIISRCFE